MIDKKDYDNMNKQELINSCLDKDNVIVGFMNEMNLRTKILDKKDIMEIYKCKNDKALKILKVMFQMGYGNKIGKEYYISDKAHNEFITSMVGKELFI